MRHILALLAALALVPGAASATEPEITVTAGQALQQKSGDYGAAEIDRLTHDLARRVGVKLTESHHAGVPTRLKLVLEDATPNRPTGTELGAATSASAHSVGLGGAWIDGSAVLPDGRQVSLGYSFYETDLGKEFGTATWADADRAFDALADQLARGVVPQKAAPGAKPQADVARFPG